MDFDFLNRDFLAATKKAIEEFRQSVEDVRPPEEDLEKLCEKIQPFPHCTDLKEDFIVGGVDGSGEFPILQQDDVFVHFAISAGKLFQTQTSKQNKLSVINFGEDIYRGFLVLRDDSQVIDGGYARLLDELVEKTILDLAKGSDYCQVFSDHGNAITLQDVAWENFAISKASQVGTHEYLIRTLAELGMAIRLLEGKPKYLLLDTSLVYFLLGKSLYLPELFKRYLVCGANEQNTAIVALSKSHNIPNGDLIGRWAQERLGHKDHWYLRLPSETLGEIPLPFLREKEVPPKLGVSYLFKFHGTSFPMRIDLDHLWWRRNIDFNIENEKQFFSELDFTCHEVRSYGYPYPLHAAHRTASLTKQERRAIKDILLQNAKSEGALRGAFLRDPETVHMEGI